MTSLYNKIAAAHNRLERYKADLLEIVEAQIRVACEVHVPTATFKRCTRLPRINTNLFAPHDYIEIDTNYNPPEIDLMWCGSGEPDYRETSIYLHPIMADESMALDDRVSLFREYLIGLKTKGDRAEVELKRALLEQQRRNLESQMIAIDDQLKGVQ